MKMIDDDDWQERKKDLNSLSRWSSPITILTKNEKKLNENDIAGYHEREN